MIDQAELLNSALALLFVIGLIALAAWLLKKLRPDLIVQNPNSIKSDIQIRQRTVIDGKCTLVHVRFKDMDLLLARTPQHVEVIANQPVGEDDEVPLTPKSSV